MEPHERCPYYRLEGEHQWVESLLLDDLQLCVICGCYQDGRITYEINDDMVFVYFVPTDDIRIPKAGLHNNPTLEMWAIMQED